MANVEKLGHCTRGSEFSDLLKNYWIWHHWPLISWGHQLAVKDGLPPDPRVCSSAPCGTTCPYRVTACPPCSFTQLATSDYVRHSGGAFHGGYTAEMLPYKLKQAPKEASGWQRRAPNSGEATCATSQTGTEEGRGALDGETDRGDREGLPHAPLLSSNRRSVAGSQLSRGVLWSS